MVDHQHDDDQLLDMMIWAASIMPLPVGQVIGEGGRYELRELAARTDHSAVYESVDRLYSVENGPESTVAIKLLLDSRATIDEARFARQVLHKNVLRVLDFGTSHGFTFLVSEYMSEGDLDLTKVPWEPRRAASAVATLADGLQAIHRAGLVHGDIKPANILLHDDGEPRLADMEFASSPAHGIERDGGSLMLLAPERLGPASFATPASDIYALGGVLYWLLTGRYPHGDNRDEIVARLAARTRPSAPGVSHDLDRVCLRALAADPHDRHAAAAELADDLRSWLGHRPIEWMRPALPRRLWLWSRRRPLRALLVITVAAALIVTPVVLHRSEVARVEAAAQREREAIENDARIKRESLRQAEEQIEQLRGVVRASVEMLSARLKGDEDRDLPAMLTSLYFFAQMGDLEGLGPEFDMLVSQKVADTLTGWREDPATRAQGPTHFAKLLRLAEIEASLRAGQFGRARELVPGAVAEWSGIVPPEDPISVALQAFELLSRPDWPTPALREQGRSLASTLRSARAFPATVELLEGGGSQDSTPGRDPI